MPDASPKPRAKRAWELIAPPPAEAPKPAAVDPGYWFDEAAADRACQFFELFLTHTEGKKWAGKPFILEPWQRDGVIRPLFGWKKPDGTRRYKKLSLWVPKKNGKTALSAGLGLYLTCADGEPGAQVYCAAASDDQADLVFKAAKAMVGKSEELSDQLTCHTTSIFHAESLSRFQRITGKPNTKHGFNVHAAIFDELHAWTDRNLYDFIVEGMGARTQPLTIIISTAGVYGEGIGWEEYDYACKVRDGVIEDPETLVVIYEAGEKDDWHAEATWQKANPNYGISLEPGDFVTRHREACESPAKENNFKRLRLNLWTEQVERAIPMDAWDRGAGTVDPAKLEGRRCYGGLDLAATTDLAALVWVFPRDDDTEFLDILCRFWIPAANMAARTKSDRVPYEKWVRDGLVTATPGNIIDYGAIRAQINADAAIFDVREIAYDPWNAMSLVTQLTSEDGLPMIEHKQAIGAMAWPTKHAEKLIIGGKIRHAGHPVLRWNTSNVAYVTDHAGNYKPTKDKKRSRGRIDGYLGYVMAAGRAGANEAEGGNVYDERGIITI
jgi:phage terminase large subunit-like protein